DNAGQRGSMGSFTIEPKLIWDKKNPNLQMEQLKKRIQEKYNQKFDEDQNEDQVTFAELYEEVKLYAAAFRKHGVTIGDRVAGKYYS
ncbi:hypothetical protein TNIN_384091, partial [Trichonephila inaurata madagascariensis]